jgi:spore coat protein U-like protein
MKLIRASGCACAVLIYACLSNAANAATSTAQFLVTANVNAACLISATDLNFGDYLTGAQLDGQSEITLVCTDTTAWNVGLNAGTGSGATVNTRHMTGPGGATINYGLFTDAARSDNWGNTVGTDTVSGTGSGTTQFVQVYGRIPSGQTTSAPGGYQDTITATVTF